MGIFNRRKSSDQTDEDQVENAELEQLAQPQQLEQPTNQIVVVDVMPKPEILDPQGKAVSNSLVKLGFSGLSVRQGKRFEISVEGEITEDKIEQIRQAAEKLLANTVIESFEVKVEEVQ